MKKILELIHYKFRDYCESENIPKIKKYLQMFPFLVNSENGLYFTIIAETGNLELLILFIENGAIVDIDNNYVLYSCAYHEHDDCLDYLINTCKIDIESLKNKCGYSYVVQRYNITK